ncbi:MAG: APC family permease, partial [Actinomycetota bacterium]|nr:APC family permease [Actinomycetota bacterium]
MDERRSNAPGSDRIDAATGTDLRPRALRLPGVLMQALTHIAPAVGMVAFIPMITSFSGITSPLAYLIAFLIVAMLGVSLMQLAKHLPSAGGYYTYVSRTVSPRVGFLAAWTLFIIELLAPGAGLGFGGFLFEGAMKAEYGITFPWWVFLLLGTALIFVVSYFGIRIAVGLSVVLSAIEILIVLVLSFSSLASPGPGGINASPFDPTKSVSTNGLFLAVVFTIFAFAGFESVAPLAEESVNPRRTIPRAIWISITISGVFYVFTGWALLTGWGTNNVKGFIAPGENPIFALAHRLWGGAWILVLLAVVNSILAIGIAATNAGTRVLYAMGRSGSLPQWLATVHPKYRTPVNTIYTQMLITLVVGLGLGLAFGPASLFFTIGLAVTLSLMVLYIAGNVGVFLYYWRVRRNEFNPVLHVIFPLLSSAALIVVGYKSLRPLPPTPTSYGALLAIGWLLVGAVVLLVMRQTGRDRWLLNAGKVFEEAPEAPA